MNLLQDPRGHLNSLHRVALIPHLSLLGLLNAHSPLLQTSHQASKHTALQPCIHTFLPAWNNNTKKNINTHLLSICCVSSTMVGTEKMSPLITPASLQGESYPRPTERWRSGSEGRQRGKAVAKSRGRGRRLTPSVWHPSWGALLCICGLPSRSQPLHPASGPLQPTRWWE